MIIGSLVLVAWYIPLRCATVCDCHQGDHLERCGQSNKDRHARTMTDSCDYFSFLGTETTVCFGSTNTLCLGQRLKNVNPLEMT